MIPQPAFLSTSINRGPWVAGYSLAALLEQPSDQKYILPVCSLGTTPGELRALGGMILPPLYHEALDAGLREAMIDRIRHCFPFLTGTRRRQGSSAKVEVVELPRRNHAPPATEARVFAFSIDTAIEQHGPHLPLATDTLESYAVLHALAAATPGLVMGPPVDYGHLTWGLPFGFSIDLTAELTTRYVQRFVQAIVNWARPLSLYVVDVHGSLAHREAIVRALQVIQDRPWRFRWLFEPLAAFAGERGDPHAGGVGTALIERISRDLVDGRYWPARKEELASRQMAAARAIELSGNLLRFSEEIDSLGLNGIVGEIRNYDHISADEMFGLMLARGRADVGQLLG